MIFDVSFVLSMESKLRHEMCSKYNLQKFCSLKALQAQNHIVGKIPEPFQIPEKKILTDHDSIASLATIRDLKTTEGSDFIYTFPKNICGNRDILEVASKISLAIKFLQKYSPGLFFPMFDELIDVIIPLSESPLIWGSGITIEPLRGYLFVGPTADKSVDSIFILAIAIVHELAHHVLTLIGTADKIIDAQNLKTYSGIRNSNRPALLSLHGLIALTYMDKFIDQVANGSKLFVPEANRLKNLIEEMVSPTLDSLDLVPKTRIGRLIFSECSNKFSSNLVKRKNGC